MNGAGEGKIKDEFNLGDQGSSAGNRSRKVCRRDVFEDKYEFCFGHEFEIPIGHLIGNVQQAVDNTGWDFNRDIRAGLRDLGVI